MAPIDDPFHWSVDQVVSALCPANKPWVQDAAELEARIREEQLDGCTLLTYEKIFSGKGLMDILSIKTARRQVSLGRQLMSFRHRKSSPAYHSWLSAFEDDLCREDDEASQTNRYSPNAAHAAPTAGEKQTNHSGGARGGHLRSNGALNEHHTDSSTTSNQKSESEIPKGPVAGTSHSEQDNADLETQTVQQSASPPAGEKRKQKRIAPVSVDPSFNPQELPWERSQSEGTYIGPGSILDLDVLNPNKRLSTWIDEGSDDEFTYMPRKRRLAPGRCLAVNRLMQRFLRKGDQTEPEDQEQPPELQTGDDPVPDATSDIDDGTESQSSWVLREEREIEAEREDERLELEAYMKRHAAITKDRIRSIIGEEIDRMATEWRERKNTILCRKAHGLWSASRRRGTKTQDVLNATKQAQVYHQRLQRMSEEIIQLAMADEKDVRRSALSLEATVEDKCYQTWLASTLNSKTEPPRPETVPKPRTATHKPVVDDPELIMSSDEDDFIVADEDDFPQANAGFEAATEDPDDENMTDLVAEGRGEAVDVTANTAVEPEPRACASDREMADCMADKETADTYRKTPARELSVKQERDGAAATKPSAPDEGKTPPVIIDLTTPTKPTSAASKKAKALFVDLADQAPSFDDLAEDNFNEMIKAGSRHWAKVGDRYKLIICLLDELGFKQRSYVYKTLKDNSLGVVWKVTVSAFLTNPPASLDDVKDDQSNTNFEITRIFLCFLRCRYVTGPKLVSPSQRTIAKLRENETPHFANFCHFVLESESLFPDASQIYRPDLSDNEFEDDYYHAVENEDEDEEAGASQRSLKGRKEKNKEIVRDKKAVDLRIQQVQRVKDQEARRQKLRDNLAMDSSFSHDKSRLIINESKDEEQSLLYINEQIGKTIKDHQIDGVRFFWNQIVTDPDPKSRQGCLLSHTMGLGKTMQVITFLVAISEAANSPDRSVRSQIPKDLRVSQTLILCPPGLVNNWMDELIKWAPEDSLGSLWQVDTQAGLEERLAIIDEWATYGGVCVMGYALFQKVVSKALVGDEAVEIEDANAARVARRLLETPNIVVADEAHGMKSLDGKLNHACHRLSTTTRLALTGSPLANHVKEYYAMIDWVAPNFLGPLQEFNEIYASVIEHGLARDSLGWEKRKASKMLQVLKETVDPKVHRATTKTASLVTDLPPKSEFMISLPPTPLQKDLYTLFIDGVQGRSSPLNLIYDLKLICAHPECFRRKLEVVQKAQLDNAVEEYLSFPKQIIDQALKLTASPNISEPALSNKVRFLLAILDEARKLGDKVLVFSHSLESMNYLENLLSVVQKRNVCRLDGSSKVSDRQNMTKSFNAGRQEIYLISTRAGGVGLNIQGANRVVLFDTDWNPVHEQQAVGRAYRLGQKKPVFVYHLKVAGSFEETLQDQAIFKTQLQQRVIDKKNPVSWGKRNGHYNVHLKDLKWSDLSASKHRDSILDSLMDNPPGGVGITKIVHTDTLEEEDPTSGLTREEMEEATKIVRLNELRRTNPAEWAKQKEEFDRWEAAREMADASRHVASPIANGTRSTGSATHSVPGSHQAPGIPGLNNYNPQSAPTLLRANGSTASHPPQMPGHVRQATEHPPPPPASQPVGQSHQDGGYHALGQAERPSSNGSASRIPPPSTAPGPVTGANTFFGQPSQPSPSTRSSTHSHDAELASPKRGGLFSQPRVQQKGRFQDKLHDCLATLLQSTNENQAGGHTANAITTSIQDELKRKDRGFLPDNQQWQTLTEMLEYERFSLAMVAGMVSAKFLASATKKQLMERLQTLNDLPKDEFRTRLVAKRMSEGSITPVSSHSDRVARLAADDNARMRRPHLPPWAVSTIHSGSDKDSAASKDDDRGSRTPRPYA